MTAHDLELIAIIIGLFFGAIAAILAFNGWRWRREQKRLMRRDRDDKR